MEYIIVIKENREQVELRLINPHDDPRIRELIRHIAVRVAERRFDIVDFVQILIEETARFLQNTGYNALLRGSLVGRITEVIDDLILDPEDEAKYRDLAEATKDHFRERIRTEDL